MSLRAAPKTKPQRSTVRRAYLHRLQRELRLLVEGRPSSQPERLHCYGGLTDPARRAKLIKQLGAGQDEVDDQLIRILRQDADAWLEPEPLDCGWVQQ